MMWMISGIAPDLRDAVSALSRSIRFDEVAGGEGGLLRRLPHPFRTSHMAIKKIK
jgi:hypothetical protein